MEVDVGAVVAVQILEDSLSRGSLSPPPLLFIVREPNDGVELLVHVVFRHHLALQSPFSPSSIEFPPYSFFFPARARGKASMMCALTSFFLVIFSLLGESIKIRN